MTLNQVQECINLYRTELRSWPTPTQPIEYPHNQKMLPDQSSEMFWHLLGMLDKIEGFIREGQVEKVMRWLGFVQGVLWTQAVFSLDELKNHNRTPSP